MSDDGGVAHDSSLEIAWCGPESAAELHDLTQASFAEQAGLVPPILALSESVDAVAAELTARRGVLVREEGRGVAGCRVVLEDDTLHVRRLAVLPTHRRRGIATALMAWLEHEAATAGLAEVRLGVRDDLPDNRRLYERLGYAPVAHHGFWTEMRKPVASRRG